MNTGPIPTLQSNVTQITNNDVDSFSNANLSWSPDGKNIVATVSGMNNKSITYLLNPDGFNTNPQNITETLPIYQTLWKKAKEDKYISQIASLPSGLLKTMVKENFDIVSWSADETKILYVASNSATLPLVLNPQFTGANSTPEERNIQKGTIYIYDMKEDKNFKILDGVENTEDLVAHDEFPLKWLPDS